MFGLLKKKISSFISSIVQTEEEKPPLQTQEIKSPEPEPEMQKETPEAPAPKLKPGPEQKKESPEPLALEPEPEKQSETKPLIREEKIPEPLKPGPILEKPAEPLKQKQKTEQKKAEIVFDKPKFEQPKPGQKPEPKLLETPKPEPVAVPRPAPKVIGKPKPEPKKEPVFEKPKFEEKKPEPKALEKPAPIFTPRVPEKKEDEKKLEVKLSLGTRIRSFISSDVEIKEGDVSELLDGLNLALLESDVAYEVAEHITGELKSKLIGMKVPKGSIDKSVKSAVRASLLEVLSLKGIDLVNVVKERQKPVKILLLGPNGAGKTTTMGKLSTLLKEAGFTSVFSASDTFRAAAIEQAEKHGERLGVRVIKHEYGADPTAVAFDAVNYARAHKIDVVLIDSAGRQETNRNLIDEMKKLNRVIQPDLKIFIGESIAGNALVNQVKSFSDAVGLDGVILTKLDCDAKGGTALSLSKATGVPILYFGVGQSYTDLIPFSAEFVVNQVMGD